MTAYDMPEGEEGQESEEEGIRGIRQAKKAAEARADAAEAELAEAREATKELAFLKAGLPEDSKTANYFRQTYTGDLTAEAIKQAAMDAGVIDDANPELTDALAGQAQMAQAIQGAQPPQFGQVTVGPPHAPVTVPADQAELYQQLEAAARRGPTGIQEMAQILRQAGHEVGGGEVESLHSSPNVVPLANQQNRII